jgi:O-antigen ligase
MLWLLIGYMFLFVHRPFEVWPVLGTFHLERMYMLGTLLVGAGLARKKWLPNRQHLAFGFLALTVAVCWMASPWASTPTSERIVEDYFKIFVFYGLLVLTIHDERNLKRLLVGLMAVMGLYLAHSLREYICGRHVWAMGIRRMIGVDVTMGDPNSFGGTIVYMLPLVVPFWLDSAGRRWRWLLAGYVLLSLVSIGLTGSRSSLLGLAVVTMLLVVRSGYRVRMAALALMLTPVLWAALPEALQTRFETIIDPSVGPANAQESAQGRIEGLLTGIQLWESNPFTGCGPGAWRPAAGELKGKPWQMVLESHNLYGQIIGELGSLGAIAMIAVLLGFWSNLRWIKKSYQLHPEWGHDFLYRVAQAIGFGVLLLLFIGNFSHNLYRYHWLWFGGFLIIARHCVEQRLLQQATIDAYRLACEAELAPTEDSWAETHSEASLIAQGRE